MTFVRESFIVFRRQVRMNLRNPAWVFIGVMQPVLYLVLFGPLLKPLVGDLGADNAYTFLVPGLLVQLGLFGAFFAGFSLIGEWREGVIEAERVTPASLLASASRSERPVRVRKTSSRVGRWTSIESRVTPEPSSSRSRPGTALPARWTRARTWLPSVSTDAPPS